MGIFKSFFLWKLKKIYKASGPALELYGNPNNITEWEAFCFNYVPGSSKNILQKISARTLKKKMDNGEIDESAVIQLMNMVQRTLDSKDGKAS